MPEISEQALFVSIQAVAAERRLLQEGARNGELEPEEYELLEERLSVEKNLEAAYNKLAKTRLNLPPYDDLVGDP